MTRLPRDVTGESLARALTELGYHLTADIVDRLFG